MGRVPSCGSATSSGTADVVGEVTGSAGGGSSGAGEAVGEVGGSGNAAAAVTCSSIGCSMTRVTSLESSAPQSVSMSSVDGGVDGSGTGASLVRPGGTEDDCT